MPIIPISVLKRLSFLADGPVTISSKWQRELMLSSSTLFLLSGKVSLSMTSARLPHLLLAPARKEARALRVWKTLWPSLSWTIWNTRATPSMRMLKRWLKENRYCADPIWSCIYHCRCLMHGSSMLALFIFHLFSNLSMIFFTSTTQFWQLLAKYLRDIFAFCSEYLRIDITVIQHGDISIACIEFKNSVAILYHEVRLMVDNLQLIITSIWPKWASEEGVSKPSAKYILDIVSE